MENQYDAIVIGSGFGGCMTAYKLINAGMKVGMIEKGENVLRGIHNWEKYASLDLTKHYDKSQPYKVIKGGNKKEMGSYSALGGPSIFYGGVSFRFREKDFKPPMDIIAESNADWPIDYQDLSPYYDEAEQLLQISGEAGIDPTEPKRNIPFPQKAPPIADISKKIKQAAESLKLNPFRLPLAINYEDTARSTCIRCTTCDTFACAIGAKNDLATMMLPDLIGKGLDIFDKTLTTQLVYEQGNISEVKCIHMESKKQISMRSKLVILAAGALGSPHLLLSSELDKYNPSGNLVGRYLMRHTNAIIFGIYPTPPDKQKIFHKELAILDYYFGHESISYPKHKIGSLQQIPTPPAGLVELEAPARLGKLAAKGVSLLTGLLAIAEDQPQHSNLISVDISKRTDFNMATPLVSTTYSDRDLAAIKVLSEKAKQIMKKTGSWLHYIHNIKTFSHAVGTVRMGNNPNEAPLDKNCNFRGVENLYVVDGSFMPTSAAVNPSLTISANALRVGDYITKKHTFNNES